MTNGLVGLQAVLDRVRRTRVKAQDVIHDWLAMVALDDAIDTARTGAGAVFTSPTLKSMVDWDNPQAYDSPGAPPNGGDFVKLPGPESVTFTGEGSYPAADVEWTSVDGRLFSGVGDDLDRAIVYSVDVPGSMTPASSQCPWSGARSLAGTSPSCRSGMRPRSRGRACPMIRRSTRLRSTIPERSPASSTTCRASPVLVRTATSSAARRTSPSTSRPTPARPWTSPSGTSRIRRRQVWASGWTAPASAARPITDGSESSLEGAKSLTEAHPVRVSGWTVQVVSYGDTSSQDGDTSSHETLTLTPQQDGSYAGSFDLGSLPLTSLGTTGAIVTADDPDENAPGYPRYSLSVDSGKALPGGS